MRPLELGGVTVEAVEEISGHRFRPDVLLPWSTPAQIADHAGWMAPDLYDPARDLLAMVRQSYVVRTGRRTIVIDTCVGDDKDRPSANFNRLKTPWFANFRALGLDPAEVDVVLCTHLHVDHVGWHTRLVDGRWVPTFPNARYLFGRTELASYLAAREAGPDPDGPIFEDSVQPVFDAGLAEIVEDDFELGDGLWLELTPGHTPGHLCIHLETPAGRAVFAGDLMHHPVQVREPQWNSRFCEDADGARRARRRFLEAHADTDTLIVPAHFERGTVGRLTADAAGFNYHFRDGGDVREPR